MSIGLHSTGLRTLGPALARTFDRMGRVGAGWIAAGLAAAFTLATLYFDRAQSFTPIVVRFLDPDDALRLAQIRQFLAGGGWFDPHIPNIGDGSGLASHWSRLIDLPIAGIIMAARTIVADARAEQIALLLWPKLVLLVFMALYLRQMLREASGEAAVALCVMLWLSFFSLVQFQLTRIDHHNVQSACAVLAIVIATAPSARRRSAFAAGLIAGLGLAIGYEALPAIGLLAGLLAMASLIAPERRAVAEGFAAGLALALSAALAVTVRPEQWTTIACDSLGLNVVGGVVVGGAGLLAAGWASGHRAGHAIAIAAAGAAALTVFAAAEPACLAGPFAKVDAAMGAIWINDVQEGKPLHDLARTKPAIAVAIGLSMLLCLLAQAALARQERSIGEGLRLALLLLLTALGFRYLKMIPYAQILGLYCLARAAFAIRWPHPDLTPRVAAMLAILIATPIPLMFAASTILPDPPTEKADAEGSCSAESDFAGLTPLAPARLLPQSDLGGYLALLPQHQTMIGNYHRLDQEILRAYAIFTAPVGDAQRMLADWRIDAIVHCAGKRIYAKHAPDGSLARAIEGGTDLPAYLEAIPMGAGTGVRAYRVIRP